MLTKLINLLTPKKTKNISLIEVKHMGEEISILKQNKILTPNIDYTILDTDVKGVSTVKILVDVEKEELKVVKAFIPWHNKKMTIRPWGFKNFRRA